ncbi:MAG: glycoside hydrolase family 15 protein [Terrimesophilobacter sp.]
MPNLPSEIGHSESAEVARLVKTSVRLIVNLQDKSGAYPASPTFSAYRGYCWFRDGAFIADGMSSVGEVESANRFFDWCSRVLESRAADVDRIVRGAIEGSPLPDRDMLPTRFTFAGGDGDDDWWDFQLDGYGTWLWAVSEHAGRHGLSLERWRPAIELTVDYLASSWQRPCFDWWEENPGEVHVSTLGCIAAGMKSISRSGILDKSRIALASGTAASATQLILDRGVGNDHLAKWVGSDAVDASLLAVVVPLRVVEPGSALGLSTIEAIDDQLNVDGGVHRYLADTFFGGGQWPLLSCLLGLNFAAIGLRERAIAQLRWAGATANEGGWMPEQVAGDLLDTSRYQEWVDRWGSVANPLLWTHAMYIRLAVELGLAGQEAQ